MALLTKGSRRALWVDVARGGAILAMVVYHFSFDLTFFGFARIPVAANPWWRAYAGAIASTFLFAVGVSLVYAHGGGIRWRSFLIRLAVLVLCAALVSAGTMLAMPAPIFFGILHAIAAFSVLALPFLRAPVWLTLATAAAVLVLPMVYSAEFFSAPYFYPLGLSTRPPFTFDYEPVFPWFAVTLLGVATGRLVPRPAPGASGYDRAGGFLRFLAATGRNSLLIYLLHQPILFGLLLLATYVIDATMGTAIFR